MKTIAITLVAFALNAIVPPPASDDSDTARFSITVNGKKGFINNSGEIVIPPQFLDAQEFSEGLCAVRIEGTYGFIDTQGTMRIAPDYDYATEFNEGLALVYLDGKPLFINSKGEQVITGNYKRMMLFQEGKSQVYTHSGKQGIIDKTGKLVIDTVYKYIGDFEGGVAIVKGLNHDKEEEDETRVAEVSVINEHGEMLVPYGKYEQIENYSDGFFEVSWRDKKDPEVSLDGYMNSKGEVVCTFPENRISWSSGAVHNGIARITLAEKVGKKRSEEHFDSYITPYGNTVYSNKAYPKGTDFKENFAFVTNTDNRISMINRHGVIIAENKFRDVAGGFRNGMALVKTKDGWGVIDTTATFILTPRFKAIHKTIIDEYIFFHELKNDSDENPKYGLADLTGNIIIQPSFQYFDKEGFVNGLLKTWIDNGTTYFNRSGHIVWQEQEWEPEEAQALNIDYMNRGYFYANINYTGHGNSSRRAEPEKVTMLNSFEGGALTVVADPFLEFNWDKTTKGMIVFVANTSGDTINFNAQDSRLYMKMQARDKDGAWRDIEYLPNSWCGNSYHHVELPANHYWTFVAPIYEGIFYTKLRVALTYIDPKDLVKPPEQEGLLDWGYRDKRELVVYSNEFEGSINPGQFWRRPVYHPMGIMDSYLE